MSPQRSANWKKRQAELLFDDFIKIKRRTGSFSKNEGASFEGDDVVSDASKRFSGTFSRANRTLASRTPEPECKGICSGGAEPSLQSALEEELPAAAVPSEENPPEEPSEESIHSAAMQLAHVGDQLDAERSAKLNDSKQSFLKKLSERGSNVSYDVFMQLLAEVLPTDRGISTFYFAMQLSYLVLKHLGWSYTSYFRQFMTEEFAEEAVTCIDGKST